MVTNPLKRSGVIILTLAAMILSSGCSYLHRHYGEQCNSRAYLDTSLADFISRRYHNNSPVRMAIVPFSSEANISARGTEFPGITNELAWKVHAEFMRGQALPIVEVFNRQDWPGKKEEFFTGNFGAISMARQAGYDLVMVGYLEPRKSLDSMAAYTKIIEAESGITVWYGKSEITSSHRLYDDTADRFWLIDKDPAKLYAEEITDSLARCIFTAANEDGDEIG